MPWQLDEKREVTREHFIYRASICRRRTRQRRPRRYARRIEATRPEPAPSPCKRRSSRPQPRNMRQVRPAATACRSSPSCSTAWADAKPTRTTWPGSACSRRLRTTPRTAPSDTSRTRGARRARGVRVRIPTPHRRALLQRRRRSTLPCETKCPAHVNVPAYIALVGEGRLRRAP